MVRSQDVFGPEAGQSCVRPQERTRYPDQLVHTCEEDKRLRGGSEPIRGQSRYGFGHVAKSWPFVQNKYGGHWGLGCKGVTCYKYTLKVVALANG